MITRSLLSVVQGRMYQGKAIIVVGARQVGKSTLLHHIVEKSGQDALILDCDDPTTRSLLTNANTERLQAIVANHRIVMIDEAQMVPNIGVTLKLIVDKRPDVQLLVSGSSALELRSNINEPLTGRKFEYQLYPISSSELIADKGLVYLMQTLEQRLIYGSYPDVLNHQASARELITNIAESYLYKDLLSIEQVRKPILIQKLLVALALQIGSEVSYNELAQTIGSDSKTVEKYIDLLEKCYVIFRLNALSRNMRTELKKGKKVFFYDNGVRNALLQNFQPLDMRSDTGALWENFVISERIKRNHYMGHLANYYFWRTTEQQEIDLIEEHDGQFSAFEMKWNPKKANAALPKPFMDNYSPTSATIVTPDNFLEVVG